MKYIDIEKLLAELNKKMGEYDVQQIISEHPEYEQGAQDALYNLKLQLTSFQQEQDMGEVSDGYHTFNELYYYRMLYNAAFFNLLPKGLVYKSKRHHTGEECFGGG